MLIGMAVYSTEENGKDACLERTLESMRNTLDFNKHRMMLSVNGHTKKTDLIISLYASLIDHVYWNEENLGTAKAINKVWKNRNPGEIVCKCDDDYVVHSSGWGDLMELGIARMEETNFPIGIIGLKRKDLDESPNRTDWARSTLIMTPSKKGERWLVLELVQHVMGTCQAYNPRLIDKMGGLYQMDGLYAYDDALSAVRCHKAGMYSAFIPEVEIDHIDEGGTPFQQWKQDYAAQKTDEYEMIRQQYLSGERSIYHPFE